MERNILDFPLKGRVTLEQVKEVQRRALKIAIIVRDIFEKENIPYSILAGTLLGAVRTGGFIPWDLDFDMAVPEDWYQRATAALETNLPEWLVFQTVESDPNYFAYWGKVVDVNSKLHSTRYISDNSFKYKGVHVDIYNFKRTNEKLYKYDLLKTNLLYYEVKYHKGFLDEKTYIRHVKEIHKELENEPKETFEIRNKFYFLDHYMVDEKYVFSKRKYSFENEIFLGPADFDMVLKNIYGNNYMKPPKYEDRDMEIDEIIFFDLE